jgi:DNA (cytosine-5)-methyltransferase 1
MGIDDSNTASVAIDNALDRFQDVDDMMIISGNHRWNPTSCLLSSSADSSQRDIVDLTSDEPAPQAFKEGDYRADEEFEILLESWLLHTLSSGATIPAEEFREATHPVHDICIDGIVYKAGQSLELHDRSYLRICTVLRDNTNAVYFSGRRLINTSRHAGTYIPKVANELVWIINETEVIPFKNAKRFVNIHFTNFCYINKDQQKQVNPNDLFCRLKESFERDGRQVSIEYLSSVEADEGYKFESTKLRQQWRGTTQAFGDHAHPSYAPTIVLDDTDAVVDLTRPLSLRERMRMRRYTFGDAFCGAGGVSCGARRAGLHMKWAFDKSEHAATTYRLNFETAECELSDVFSFLTNSDTFLRVDVSHGSPPCQTFSPAHTVESVHDDANSSCIFSCADIIKRSKPRIHTMEETSGLFNSQHRIWFYRVIQDFLEIGYSVRWSILNCVEYGVPQLRKRLIIIASGYVPGPIVELRHTDIIYRPGETLPPLPQPSHGPGLREYSTVHNAISTIPMGAANHDVGAALKRGLDKEPYDAHQQVRTITCGGGENNYHPCGLRNFTNRELACLQTFPMSYRFGPRETRIQIGNAVPPLLAEAFLKEAVRSLEKTDEEELCREYTGE